MNLTVTKFLFTSGVQFSVGRQAGQFSGGSGALPVQEVISGRQMCVGQKRKQGGPAHIICTAFSSGICTSSPGTQLGPPAFLSLQIATMRIAKTGPTDGDLIEYWRSQGHVVNTRQQFDTLFRTVGMEGWKQFKEGKQKMVQSVTMDTGKKDAAVQTEEVRPMSLSVSQRRRRRRILLQLQRQEQ